MKTFENKQTDLNSETGKARYADLALTCLNQPPQGGYTPVEMNKRLRVVKAMEENKEADTIDLEDQDVETLQQAVASARWMILKTDIAEFNNHVESL